jgi:hypothetical protein
LTMIWNDSDNIVPQIASDYSDVLKIYDTEWYKIRLGYMFDPEHSKISTSVLYHVINVKTGVIEYQGSYLPSCINNVNELSKFMKEFDKTPDDLPRITFN